uniref:Uncharacterized protein n=1 Tax=Arundo donax TaxID=35708 RepID=A0A0A9HHK0_ARUDO
MISSLFFLCYVMQSGD